MVDASETRSGSVSEDFFVGIIDGTGPSDVADYDRAMEPGFCKQFARMAFGRSTAYERGPGPFALDSRLSDAIKNIYDKASAQSGDIVLIGYSRGGLGCMIVAERLKRDKRYVRAMVLLDPVDRYIYSLPNKLVPNNVISTFVACRLLSNSLVSKYEGTMSDVAGLLPSWAPDFIKSIVAMRTPSNPVRPSFSGTAMGFESGEAFDGRRPYDHTRNGYACSHGAMGGVGYHWVDEDLKCQTDLIGQLEAWLRLHVVYSGKLKPGYDEKLREPQFRGVLRELAAAGIFGNGLSRGAMTFAELDQLIYAWKSWRQKP